VLDWNEPALNFYKKYGAQQVNDWVLHRLTEEEIGGLLQ